MNLKECLVLMTAVVLTGTAWGEIDPKSFTAPDGVKFRVAEPTWGADMRGNHRAVVMVEAGCGKYAKATLEWRRADRTPERKKVVVTTADNREIANVKVLAFSAERAEVLFEPIVGAGEYHIYYLPYKRRMGCDDMRYNPNWTNYLPVKYAAAADWLAGAMAATSVVAKVVAFEARTEFECFTPMGITATTAETAQLSNAHPENPVVFAEDRRLPIKIFDRLPAGWVGRDLSATPSWQAERNEYFVWQWGVWAHRAALEEVRLQFSDLVMSDDGHAGRVTLPASGCSGMVGSRVPRDREAVIPASAITCFNQEGLNWDGSAMTIKVNVPRGGVQAMWCGVQIPESAKPGRYCGKATLTAKGMVPRELPYEIVVGDKVLADHGDGDLWRLSRLRWLNSRIGLDDLPVTPYGTMTVEGNAIAATGKRVVIGDDGLLRSLVSVDGVETLAGGGHAGRVTLPVGTMADDAGRARTPSAPQPMRFVVETAKGVVPLAVKGAVVKREADGLVTWNAKGEREGIAFQLEGRMEFDGFIDLKVKVASVSGRDGEGAIATQVEVKDVRFEVDYAKAASEYLMGAGFAGDRRPANWEWGWKGPNDSLFITGAHAGLHLEMVGGKYHGPLLNDYKPAPPPMWANAGKGRVRVTGAEAAKVVVSTGATTLNREGTTYEVHLLPMPVKKLDPAKRFNIRYYHSPENYASGEARGANVFNIHHSWRENPVINYPFIARQEMKDLVAERHRHGSKLKVYYTIRELTNRAAELHMFRSLGDEIVASGPGNGAPWLCEHMLTGYRGAWYTNIYGNEDDAAFVTSPFSRWINYYLEGIRWMIENYDIDGLYMDDVSFDRPVMKRIRKVMERAKPGQCLIDLHSNTGYSKGPMNQYAGFFPYVDTLWFGESFRYDDMGPDKWFTTFSGIPFGLMSEMLQGGGNRFRGAVYGTTARLGYGTPDHCPAPVWKLWKEFGIAESKMLGYWEERVAATPSDRCLKATVFVKGDQALIAVGNFSWEDREFTLDFDKGIWPFDPTHLKLRQPAVEKFQAERTFAPGEKIPVKGKQGVLLLLRSSR